MLEADKARGTWSDPHAGLVPFREYASRWLSTKADVHPKSLENIDGRVRNHFAAFSRTPIGSITTSEVLAWRAALKETHASDTVNAALGTLRQILALALQDGIIGRNPCDGVKPLPINARREIHPATPEQIMLLANAITARYRAAIVFAGLGSGLRAGELWALKQEHVDLPKRTVRVVESVSETRQGLITKPPKNGKPRTVRLDPATVDVLADHLMQHPSPEGFIFTSPQGKQVRHRNFMDDHFYPAIDRVGQWLPEGFRFHDLRHSHASILIARGWRPEQVKDRLGHGSIRTTLDWYGHLFKGHDAEQLSELAQAFREVLVPKLCPPPSREGELVSDRGA
jgi:integrase